MTEFEVGFFVNNRKRLLASTKAEVIILASNGLLQRSGDTAFRFRQDSNFWYLTGVNEPDCWLLVTPAGDYLVLPDREPARDLWEGPINRDKLVQISGVKAVITHKELEEHLTRLKNKAIGSVPAPEPYMSHSGFYTNPHRSYLGAYLKKLGLIVKDVRIDIARLRQIKQPTELEAIKCAVDTTCQTLSEIKSKLDSFNGEAELERAVSVGFLHRGLAEHAYQPIVAAGKNAATLHYVDNDSQVAKSDLVLLDVGAECMGYAADITRTWSVGKPSLRQKLVHDLVLQIQQFAFEQLKPGVRLKEYEKLVADFAAEVALENKLISIKSEIRKIYPHATSHFLGLDVHDAADYELPLEPNMVLTVEPGLYLAEEGIGVRIEDDVVITKTGIKNLSGQLSPQI